MRKMPLFMFASFVPLFSWASMVSAQPRDWGAYPMGWQYMWGGMGIGMMFFMLVFWVLVIAGGVALIRWLWKGADGPASGLAAGGMAEEILKTRYAKGEIDKQEFEAKLSDIRKS